MTDKDKKARIDGVLEGLELAVKILEATQRYEQKMMVRRRVAIKPTKQKYDWIDHACGISLIDKMLGIK